MKLPIPAIWHAMLLRLAMQLSHHVYRCFSTHAAAFNFLPADMPDMFAGGFNPAMLSQMDPASLAQLQKMAAQVRLRQPGDSQVALDNLCMVPGASMSAAGAAT
jgi:hypothetical protein